MDSFGGTQRYAGICDAAGGFYQFCIKPGDRHKTAFVLPTSMGGTSFQWRVAPYGLTRNPAGYSRGMMFALQHMHKVHLEPMGQSTGGCSSWIDDISMHADSFTGFKDLFGRILARIASASMQLKAAKCFLLHAELEVLGFYVTPDDRLTRVQGQGSSGRSLPDQCRGDSHLSGSSPVSQKVRTTDRSNSCPDDGNASEECCVQC